MSRARRYSPWVLAVLAAMAVGCESQLKRDYAQLQAQYNARSDEAASLDAQNRQLLDELAAMQSQLAARDDQLQSFQGQQTRTAEELARLRQQLEQERSQARDTGGGWTETDRTARITVGSDVLFDSGRATLTAAGKSKVAEIAGVIRQRFPNSTVLVYGHTDTDPIRRTRDQWQDNLDLSANRAMAVTRELMARGVASTRVETIGMGPWHPVGSEKARNRRVEIVVLK